MKRYWPLAIVTILLIGSTSTVVLLAQNQKSLKSKITNLESDLAKTKEESASTAASNPTQPSSTLPASNESVNNPTNADVVAEPAASTSTAAASPAQSDWLTYNAFKHNDNSSNTVDFTLEYPSSWYLYNSVKIDEQLIGSNPLDSGKTQEHLVSLYLQKEKETYCDGSACAPGPFYTQFSVIAVKNESNTTLQDIARKFADGNSIENVKIGAENALKVTSTCNDGIGCGISFWYVIHKGNLYVAEAGFYDTDIDQAIIDTIQFGS